MVQSKHRMSRFQKPNYIKIVAEKWQKVTAGPRNRYIHLKIIEKSLIICFYKKNEQFYQKS
jgi:hypothetical protein